MIVNELITELEKIIEFYKIPSANFDFTNYNSSQDAIHEMNLIISGLKNDDNNALDRLSFLFAPASVIQDISIDSGWSDEYMKISTNVDVLIGKLRQMQKKDASLFANEHDGKYTNSNSYASCPGRLAISNEKWKKIQELFPSGFFQKLSLGFKRARVQEYIRFGDTQPAVVVSENPLLVAAYSDEMDAVVLLRFPQDYLSTYNLKKNDRLITVNVYSFQKKHYDINIGPKYLKRYSDFTPHIGDFLSSESEKIKKHKDNIPEKIWLYVTKLGEEYLIKCRGQYRQGFWFIK